MAQLSRETINKTVDELSKVSNAIVRGSNVTGALLSFSVADGYAHYVVTKARPLTVAYVDSGDGYQTHRATIRGLRKRDVEGQLERSRMHSRSAKEGEDFYSSLKVSEIVHYDNGFNSFVRCKVVRENNENVLLPIGLVGNWEPYDLPKRARDGSINWGYQVRNIREAKTFAPHFSNIYEGSESRRNRSINPIKLNPIDVSGPAEMDSKENKEAQLWKTIGDIHKVLNDYNEDPHVTIDKIKELLG